jgi:hypothetical protein
LTKYAIITLAIILCSLITTTVIADISQENSFLIPTNGTLNNPQNIEINIDTTKIIGINHLSLGFHLDWDRWKTFTENQAQKDLAQQAGFKMIRVFDFRPTNPSLMPCIYWNETTKKGVWNWTNVDSLIGTILEVGAEPFVTLGWARDGISEYIPQGMAVNPSTGLPYPESYAAYAKEWVKHYKSLGLPVKYYDIMNEPYFYFGWNGSYQTRLENYAELWNSAAKSMRQESPNILISQDSITMKNVFDYWISNCEPVDFLDMHKYDEEVIGEYSDDEMFIRAEQRQYESSITFYGVEEARQKWHTYRGTYLKAINSESNFNCYYETGTDARIQQMSGAIWLALSLRTAILKGFDYNVYFEFSSSKSWQKAYGKGWGFGMINGDDNKPWYPYFVNKMIGANLHVRDRLVESCSSSDDVRSLAWINGNKLNILLIGKKPGMFDVALMGVKGTAKVTWIDDTTSPENPSTQTTILASSGHFLMNGYTVALVQSNL